MELEEGKLIAPHICNKVAQWPLIGKWMVEECQQSLKPVPQCQSTPEKKAVGHHPRPRHSIQSSVVELVLSLGASTIQVDMDGSALV